jgi:hypothetical protein
MEKETRQNTIWFLDSILLPQQAQGHVVTYPGKDMHYALCNLPEPFTAGKYSTMQVVEAPIRGAWLKDTLDYLREYLETYMPATRNTRLVMPNARHACYELINGHLHIAPYRVVSVEQLSKNKLGKNYLKRFSEHDKKLERLINRSFFAA